MEDGACENAHFSWSGNAFSYAKVETRDSNGRPSSSRPLAEERAMWVRTAIALFLIHLAVPTAANSQTLTCYSDSFGTTRCSNGQSFYTDSFGTTRDNRGNSWYSDSFGTTRGSDGTSYYTDSFGTTRDNRGNSWYTDSFGTTRGSNGSSCYTDAFGVTRCN